MPFLPAFLSWAPMTTMGSRPGGPTTDLPAVTRPLHLAPGAVMAAPRAMPGPVMPGVRRTPGRLRGCDARGGPDPPPFPGYFTAYITRRGDTRGKPPTARPVRTRDAVLSPSRGR